MKPEFITFTGADDWTSIDGMRELSRKYPIEWGVLFSQKRQGVDPRYPGGEGMSRLLWSNLRMSAHLCGGYSDAIMAGEDLLNIPADLAYFRRIQVNHADPKPARIMEFRSGWGRMRCIAQARGEEFPKDTSVDWLCDASCGRGLTRTSWPKHPGRLVGYAGGFNPVNVLEAIAVIGATGPYWIDMESGVRTDDRFDLDKCRRVCEQVYGGST
jgi:hypothetical protein